MGRTLGLVGKPGEPLRKSRNPSCRNPKGELLQEKKEEKICDCQKYDLIWGGKVSCEFRKKVVQIEKNLGLPQTNHEGASRLMTIMTLESAYSFNPKCGTFIMNPDENSFLIKEESGKYFIKSKRFLNQDWQQLNKE